MKPRATISAWGARKIVHAGLCVISALACWTGNANAQHPVLFETFTNSFDLCPKGNTFDAQFKSVVTSKGSEIIHLNHHVANIGDPMAQSAVGSNQTISKLGGFQGGTELVFVSAVDRATFASNSAQLSPTPSDWTDLIDQRAGIAAPAEITLVNATIDKAAGSTYTFSADVDVTSNTDLANDLVIRYAILQDKVTYAQCNGTGPGTHNDVVRYITTVDSVVKLKGTSAGTTVHVHYTQKINQSDPRFKVPDMKFIAFLEDGNGTVVNAATLKKDLDTLKAPTQSLSLVDASIDGKTFHPGDIVNIDYNSNNVRVVSAAYSLDNGVNWHPFANAASSPVTWTVPDSATTQGKFRLTSVPDGTPVATQKGTFTIIAAPHSLTLLHPNANDTFYVNGTSTIQWRKAGVPAVNILYTPDGGINWDTVVNNYSGGHPNDTSYSWQVPFQPSTLWQVRLVPVGVADVPVVTSEIFHVLSKTTGGVASRDNSDGLTLQASPDPVFNGENLRVSFTTKAGTSVTLEVLDMLGRRVLSQTGYATENAGEFTLATRTIAKGSYIVRLTDGEHTATKRIVVQ